MIKKFTAFDFETASGKSPCSIGVAVFENGKLTDSYYSLINPEISKFNPFTTRIHGIRMEDVLSEKKFYDVWGEISHYFDSSIIVAHNSSFDISVLNYSLDRYFIRKPDYDCYCTLKLARAFLKLNNFKLSSLAKHYSVRQENYHNALEDALVCGEIFQKLINEVGEMEALDKANSSSMVYSKGKAIRNNNSILNRTKEIKELLNKESNILSDKKIVVSGVFTKVSRTELKKLIEDNGGKVSSSISSKTSYVVAGDNMGPSKRTKAEGLGVPIISEEEFLALL